MHPTIRSVATPNLSPPRAEFSAAQWGVAAPSTSQQFKTRNDPHKPFALKWDHHLNQESASRAGSSLKAAFKHLQNPNVISLGGGLPLGEYFPLEMIDFVVPGSGDLPDATRLVKLQAGKHDRANGSSIYDLTVALNYSQGNGSPQLLRWLTEHTEIVHDPPYADWQCTMTIGNTSALDMILRMFTKRGDCVLADEFTFATASETAAPMGVSFVGVEMDDQGMLPESLRYILNTWNPEAHQGAARPFLLYAIPTGQNPTGATQGLHRRTALYKVAQQFDLIILEDDPYYFLQLDADTPTTDTNSNNHMARPEVLRDIIIPSYLSMDIDGRVVRMDSFSKVISPGSRVGWLTASQQIVEKYKSHADVSTQGPSGFSQLALFKLLDEHWGHAGYFNWLLYIRQEYIERRDFTIEAFNRELPKELVTWVPAPAGMFQWLEIDWKKHPDACTKSLLEIEEEIWLESIKQGALIARGSWFHVSKGKPLQDLYFRTTFAAAPLDEVAAAITRFGKALRINFRVDELVP